MKLDKHDRVAIYDILAEGYENAWDAVDSISECFLDINDYREDERIAELEAENKRLREALHFYADPETYIATSLLTDPPLCKHDWVGDENCAYCMNEELEAENKRLREVLEAK